MRFLKEHYARIIVCFLGALLLIFESVAQNNKDFDIFIGASRLISEGKTCYEVWLKSGTSGLKYFYSPLFAVLLLPLKDWPQTAYNFLWMSLSFVVIYRCFTLLSFFLPVNEWPKNKKRWFYIATIACIARMLLDNLALGQMTFIMAWGSMEAMRLIWLKKSMPGAALLALIINIKILPVALLAYLIYKKEFKGVILTALFFIVYLYLPAIFIGYKVNQQLLHDWLASLTSTQAKSIYDDIGRSSLSALIPSFLLDTPIQFATKRNFVSLTEDNVNLVLNSVRVLFLILVAILLGKPFKAVESKKTILYDMALVCLATPLIFPHQGKYSYFYMLPAYGYCVYELIRLHALQQHNENKKIYRFALLFAVLSFMLMTLTTDGVIGRQLSDFAEYLHCMVYGAFCLLGSMVMLRPAKILQR